MVEILSDEQRKAEQICLEGIELCAENDHEGAHKLFLQAYEMDSTSPKINSWLGYTTGLVERRVQKALDYCRRSIEGEVPDALFYRNLGKVYLLQNNKRAAFGAFAKGLQIDSRNGAILREWKELGFRRKVPFPFLDRSHFANKLLGKFTWWMTRKKRS